MTSPTRRARKRRELPERLRPLAELVELANVTDEKEINRLRSARQRLDEAQHEAFSRASHAFPGIAQPDTAMEERAVMAAEEIRLIHESFSARMSGHDKAVATLLRLMRIGEIAQFRPAYFYNLFDTIASVRSALRAVAEQLNLEGDFVRLPEICNTRSALVRRVDRRVRVFAVPMSNWLLPMLDGLNIGQLKICGACWKLYVARRHDQLGCSRKCGDTVYMRRYRRAEYRHKNKPGSEWRKRRMAMNDLMRKRDLKQ
jgi:hypothetical protein